MLLMLEPQKYFTANLPEHNCPKERVMDESEYEFYLNQVEQLYSASIGETILIQRLLDEDFDFVPGCYRTMPVETEE